MKKPEVKPVSCPVCGSAEFDTRTEDREIGDRFSGPSKLEEAILVCRNCGADGDFAGENDKRYEIAMEDLSKKAVANMLDTLVKRNISMAHFERVMGLPQRTAARWKKDGASAAAVTLLKTVVTLPWVMEVAEKDFEPLPAQAILIREACKAFQDIAEAKGAKPEFEWQRGEEKDRFVLTVGHGASGAFDPQRVTPERKSGHNGEQQLMVA